MHVTKGLRGNHPRSAATHGMIDPSGRGDWVAAVIGSLGSEGTEQLRFKNAEALGQSCSVVEIASWPLQGNSGFLLRKRGGGGSIEPLKTGGVWKRRSIEPFWGAGSGQGLYQPPPNPPSCGGHRPPCVCTALCVHRLVYALPCVWTALCVHCLVCAPPCVCTSLCVHRLVCAPPCVCTALHVDRETTPSARFPNPDPNPLCTEVLFVCGGRGFHTHHPELKACPPQG